jgi:hypothetical protein
MSRSIAAAFLACCCLTFVGCDNNKTTEGAAKIDGASAKACCADGEKAACAEKKAECSESGQKKACCSEQKPQQ